MEGIERFRTFGERERGKEGKRKSEKKGMRELGDAFGGKTEIGGVEILLSVMHISISKQT